MRSRSFLVLAVATVLVAAAPAHAATPFTAPLSGQDPSVAVGADGSGHFVWATDTSDSDIAYCRVAANGTECNKTWALDFGASASGSIGRPRVFVPAPNRIVLVGGCTQCPSGDITNKIYRWVSTNNGETFSGPTLTGTGPGMAGAGTWLDDLGIYINNNGARAKAMNAALAGDGVEFAAGGYVYSPEVVRGVGNELVAASSNLGAVRYGVYTSGTGTVSAFNTAANWSVSNGLSSPEPDSSLTSLSSGPNGVVLAYVVGTIGNPRVAIRRFDSVTNTFGPATYVEGDDPIDNDTGYLDSAQDASGRVHVVWRSLHADHRLRYRVSDPTLTSWGPVGTLAGGESFTEPEIAAGPDGRGFVVWTPSISGMVRIVAIDPRPESGIPPSSGPGGTTTPPGTATSPPVLTPPRRTGSAATPAGRTYRGPSRSNRTSVAGGSVQFGVPGKCVNPGQKFTVTLKWAKKKRKGAKFVKVTRTDFYIAKKRVRIDRKAPFRHTMTVVASTKKGATITLRARAFIKVKRGKGPKKSIRATVKVCS